VYAAVLRVLFWRIGRLYMEHLIFMLHVYSFAFLITLPLMLIPLPFMAGNTFINLSVVPAYTFFAMRRVYGQGAGKTVGKVLLLTLSEFALSVIVGISVTLYFVLR